MFWGVQLSRFRHNDNFVSSTFFSAFCFGARRAQNKKWKMRSAMALPALSLSRARLGAIYKSGFAIPNRQEKEYREKDHGY
jgi:hypothetical protein